jgi:hypothetical protein
MSKIAFIVLLACCLPALLPAQQRDRDKAEILSILDRQTRDWNRGDIDGFMVGYWNSDSLKFIGKSGITYGYKQTLNNYKKNYSDTAQMGKLSFQILDVRRLSDKNYFVIGKWMLKRTVGDLSGHYTLLFEKKNGRWVIVADHSS